MTGRPAKPYYVAIYINHLLFVGKNKGCITAALYAIRWGHRVVGMESPTDNPLVKLAYEGALRMCGGETTKKDPMTVDAVNQVVLKYANKYSNLMDLRFTIVCLLGFAGFMRIEELLQVRLKHLTIFGDRLEIFLPHSKNDQHREGKKIVIAKTFTQFCPVEKVKQFLTEAKLCVQEEPEAFLVPKLHKTKKGHKASKTSGISYTTIRELFVEKMDTIREDDENLGLHNLRSGGASSAAHNGVSDRLISKHGRWRSEKARDGYIKGDKRTRMSVSLSLGL